MSQVTSGLSSPLDVAAVVAREYLNALQSSPVGAAASLQQLRRRLDIPLTDQGVDATQVIEDLVAGVEGGLLGNAGGRFFGWVIGGALPVAVAAEWLTAAWDQNAALYSCSPASGLAEETAGRWLKELLNLPPSASFAFVTGGQMAHSTCLAVARHAILARTGWDVEHRGLAGSAPIRILSSTEMHGSIIRAIRFLGLGEKHLIFLPVDERGCLREESLKTVLENTPAQPTIVVLQAGDLNIGAFDNFKRLIPLAKSHGAWTHVDGAFGLWAGTSPRFRHLLEGVEAADSWIADGHKWLNVPQDCGYSFIADPEAHRAAISHRVPYLTHDAEARDQIDWNPEWSRRSRGFATYSALRHLGKSGVREMIERTCDHARILVDTIGSLPGAEVMWEPQINQGLVRFLDPIASANEQDHDAFTETVIAKIVEAGRAFFTGTTWRGRRAMRVSVCNWQTSSEDVRAVCSCVATVLDRLRAQGSDSPQKRGT